MCSSAKPVTPVPLTAPRQPRVALAPPWRRPLQGKCYSASLRVSKTWPGIKVCFSSSEQSGGSLNSQTGSEASQEPGSPEAWMGLGSLQIWFSHRFQIRDKKIELIQNPQQLLSRSIAFCSSSAVLVKGSLEPPSTAFVITGTVQDSQVLSPPFCTAHPWHTVPASSLA